MLGFVPTHAPGMCMSTVASESCLVGIVGALTVVCVVCVVVVVVYGVEETGTMGTVVAIMVWKSWASPRYEVWSRRDDVSLGSRVKTQLISYY